MTSSRGGVQTFLAGAVCSAAIIYFYQKVSDTRTRRIESRLDPNEAIDSPAEIRMDSCSLDQRMIRKAEGAIRNRTSRLIVVVERCTNDHNYSAILRTVEALGVQHVYIIAPQCIQSTLTSNNEDDCEVGDVKVMELKRSSGQLIKKATESEIRDRAMHHLYARKATEWLTVTGKRKKFITYLPVMRQ
jgi:tRNA G18 (ribose-2'-O)-methylase SpoU